MALVWFEHHDQRAPAAARERQIKKWRQGKKRELAKGQLGFGVNVWVSLDSVLRWQHLRSG